MRYNGIAVKVIRAIFNWIKNHFMNFLIMASTSLIGYLGWMYFTNVHHNDVLIEVFRAIFIASIIGFFIEGVSFHESLKKQIQKLNENQNICINRQACCGVLLPGIQKADIVNVWFPRTQYDPIDRMNKLISETKKVLWVKQVSLFQLSNRSNGKLYEAFKKHYLNIKDIRLLLINPESNQAKIRSYRERCLDNTKKQINYEDFIKEDKWRQEVLYQHTSQSISDLCRLREVYQENNRNHNFKIKKFFSSPEAAIIITDNTILYEPLHFGSLQDAIRQHGDEIPILSSSMPIFEFTKKDDPGVYEIIKNSFTFVFNNFSDNI